MPGETSFAKIKFAQAADETKAFPAEVSEAGAKTIDKLLEERLLTVKKYAAGATLKSGELAVSEKTAETFTLPLAATENQLIGIFSLVAETKITTSGGATIFGDFTEAATCKLTTNQHIVVQSAGGKWLIDRGEPQRETKWGALTARTFGTEYEPSATRPAMVSLLAQSEKQAIPTGFKVVVGGVEIAEFSTPKETETFEIGYTFETLPGEKWVANLSSGWKLLRTSYRIK